MKFRHTCLLVLVVLGVVGIGCDEETQPVNGHSVYASPTAPESLISNLQVSYRRREIEAYAKILAPEFIFKFQPIDQSEIGKEFWTHDEDSVGTRALLTSPEVAEVRILLLHSGRDTTTVNFPGTPIDSVRIRIITTDFEVDETDGVTWVVSDQQDMFFRKGLAANGENPTHWFLYRWDDLPSLASPKPIAVRSSTWGMLKNRYK